MKHIVTIMALLIATAAYAQQQPDLGLIPTPQQVSMAQQGAATANINKAKVKTQKVDSLPVEANMQQAYRIVVEPRRITIQYTHEQGLQYALITLEQLKQIYGAAIPCCTILDWPAYRLRGWMDDISRGPVTDSVYRQKQWRMLHALKYNFCNYYTEHTLYDPTYPDLAPRSANTARHADEVINLQLFAHAEKTLRIPYYEHMMDSRANYNPDNEATYQFLRQRIRQAWHQIPLSPYFIIDCDETEQLGTGRAKRLVDSLGADEVYIRHINRCYQMVMQEAPRIKRPAGAEPTQQRVVMWGDIVAKNPAMMKQLPNDMVYIMWAYDPLDSYDHLIAPFREQGNPFWVAPSLSHSGNMMPAPQRYMTNIANLARDGYRNGAEALMNTCWDDNGEALFDNCWHGLYWSAEMAWNPLKTNDPAERKLREERFNNNFERLFYGNNGNRRYVDQLYNIGALEGSDVVGEWYASAALMEPLFDLNPYNTSDQALHRAQEVLHMLGSIAIDSAANPHAHYAAARMRATANKTILRYTLANKTVDPRQMAADYLQQLFDLKREYLRLWDQENGEYERYIVCNRYDALAREVIDMDRHIFVSVESRPTDVPLCTLTSTYGDRSIYYTLDGSEPTTASTLYTEPFAITQSATLRAIAYNEYGEGVETTRYLLSHKAMGSQLKLGTPFATYKPIYSGGGVNALADGQLGSNTTYADGRWQGYWGDSINATIDFGSATELHTISMRFMQNTFDWILAPTAIRVYTSADGQQWTLAADEHYSMDPRETGMRLRQYNVGLAQHTEGKHGATETYPVVRYLRVVVPNPGPLPEWHPAPGQPSYLFTDEIVVH